MGMEKLLLKTKLFIPEPPKKPVVRERLIERLDQGMRGKLTVISAPAGFGKTTLLSIWIKHSQYPVVWLSLDENDNDPNRFLIYLFAALHELLPSIDGEALAWIQTPQPFEIERVLTVVINTLLNVEDEFTLVLDDYHLIENRLVHGAISFLIDHLPPKMHVIITTRADPPLLLSRLRARGQLLEIRANDLRFTPEEAREFFQSNTGWDLSAEDLIPLLERTEGWVAALRMAVLSSQNRDDIHGFIQDFRGSRAFVADYLKEEVLSRQPQEIRSFLLQTSILDRLCGSLCEAVTGDKAGSHRLKTIKESNLFVEPLDDEEIWFRYHRLFADLLQQQLQSTQNNDLPQLHLRACQWYENNAMPQEAIRHALCASDYERATRLVSAVAEELMMQGQVSTLVRWIEMIPEQAIRRNVSLCQYYAWALVFHGEPMEKIDAWVKRIQASPGELSPLVLPLNAYIALMRGQEKLAGEYSRQALAQLGDEERFLRSVALWIKAVSGLRETDIATGSRVLEEFYLSAKNKGNLMLAVLVLCNQAELRLHQGRLQQSYELYRRAIEAGGEAQLSPMPVTGLAMIGLGEIEREWNNLEAAENYLLQGMEICRKWSQAATMDGLISLAMLRQSQGNPLQARELLNEAMEIARKFDATEIDDWIVGLAHSKLCILQGDLETARSWFEQREMWYLHHPQLEDIHEEKRLQKYDRLVWGRLLVAEGKHREALEVLQALPPSFKRRERVRPLIEVYNLIAIAYQSGGEVERAMHTLTMAVEMASPGGLIRIFIDEGQPMAQMLYKLAQRDTSSQYLEMLLGAFPLDHRKQIYARVPEFELVQPLSQRENEVLGLIAEGHTNQEIARILVLAESTIKVHTRNIYRKLDVTNRTQALKRARNLGIL